MNCYLVKESDGFTLIDTTVGGALVFHDLGHKSGGIQLSAGIGEDAHRQYVAHYSKVDAWFYGTGEHLQAGWSGLGRELVAENELRKTEFYNDYLRHNNMFHQCGLVLDRDEKRVGTLTLLRAEEELGFEAHDVVRLKLLLPHLQRVLRLQSRLSQMESSVTGLQAAFEGFDQAVFGLAADGTVAFMNGSAGHLVASGRLIFLKQNRLALRNPAEDAQLQTLVRHSTGRGVQAAVHPGGAMLAHGDGGQTMRIVSMPFLGESAATPGLAAILFVHDPMRRPASRARFLTVLYGLTPAEVRVAELLAEGFEVSAIAPRLAISTDTVRFHLKSVFQKMKVNRQVDVVRLLLTLPGAETQA